MSLGKEIRKARVDKGWQQKDLHVSTGLSQKYLSAIELDRVSPRFHVVQRIARALEISLDQLGAAMGSVSTDSLLGRDDVDE